MKKNTLPIFLFLSIFWLSCQSDEGCQQPPCPKPNINELIELKLRFPDGLVGDEIRLVRIERMNQVPLDTFSFTLTSDKEIIIGKGGSLGFTEPTSGSEAIQEATLDFHVMQANQQRDEITEILILRLTPECGCSTYFISTLNLNGQPLEFNSANVTLNL